MYGLEGIALNIARSTPNSHVIRRNINSGVFARSRVFLFSSESFACDSNSSSITVILFIYLFNN